MGYRPGDTSSHPRAAGSSSSSVDTTRGDGDTTRGDGDTTRGDGDAEDTGEPTRRGHDGHVGVVESWDLNRHTCHGKTLRQTFLLQDTVIFLLPSAFMSARRRGILLPEIQRKGGEVTEDPSAATHCVMTPFPVEEQRLKQLCTKYGVPDSCICVPDSFLLLPMQPITRGDLVRNSKKQSGNADDVWFLENMD